MVRVYKRVAPDWGVSMGLGGWFFFGWIYLLALFFYFLLWLTVWAIVIVLAIFYGLYLAITGKVPKK